MKHTEAELIPFRVNQRVWAAVMVISFKIEKILQDILDLIPSPSPSVKIQIVGVKGVKAKHYWALSTNILYLKVC